LCLAGFNWQGFSLALIWETVLPHDQSSKLNQKLLMFMVCIDQMLVPDVEFPGVEKPGLKFLSSRRRKSGVKLCYG